MSSKFRDECPVGCKLFVGNLDRNLSQRDLRRIFTEFGAVRDVWLATNPPGFGFVMFENSFDAKEALQKMNNKEVSGRAMTVEVATGNKRRDGSANDERRNRRHEFRDAERSPHQRYGRYDIGSGDRCFYSSEYKRNLSPYRERRHRRSPGEDNSRRKRSPDERRTDRRTDSRRDEKNRDRRRTSDH